MGRAFGQLAAIPMDFDTADVLPPVPVKPPERRAHSRDPQPEPARAVAVVRFGHFDQSTDGYRV